MTEVATALTSEAEDMMEGTYRCPECEEQGVDNLFGSPQALGKHRQAAHGIAGARNKKKRTSKTATPKTTTLDRAALYKAIFPNGIINPDPDLLEETADFMRIAESLYEKGK